MKWSNRAVIAVLALSELTASADGEVALIVRGRPAGITGWLLSTLRLGDRSEHLVSELVVDHHSVRLTAASLHGKNIVFMPTSAVAVSRAAYTTPFHLVVVAGLLALAGLTAALQQNDAQSLLALWTLAGAFTAAYYLRRRLSLEIESESGFRIILSFKPGLIEQVFVDLGRLHAATDAIATAVVRSRQR